jgi:hypothetical protein
VGKRGGVGKEDDFFKDYYPSITSFAQSFPGHEDSPKSVAEVGQGSSSVGKKVT